MAIETRDHRVIRAWADIHGATPFGGSLRADGNERRAAGPLRFRKRSSSLERSLAWADWLTTFDARGLCFVFEATVSTRSLASSDAVARAGADLVPEGASSRLQVDAESTGRFRLKRARVGF